MTVKPEDCYYKGDHKKDFAWKSKVFCGTCGKLYKSRTIDVGYCEYCGTKMTEIRTKAHFHWRFWE